MYRYYEKAAICYAYLADVPSDENVTYHRSAFCKSRWFTRGWTLQELIAPSKVDFYSKDWVKLGSKNSLFLEVSRITKMRYQVFLGHIQDFSVASKMSWAAHRKTTRVEDMAYCLLGIFGINMPLLYGEGKKAFLRLQEEIMKVSEDQSLFAWTRSGHLRRMDLEPPLGDEGAINSQMWCQQKLNQGDDIPSERAGISSLTGLLATSPADFAHGAHVYPLKNWPGYDSNIPMVRGEIVRIHFPLWMPKVQNLTWREHLDASFSDLSFAILGCSQGEAGIQCVLLLPLIKWHRRFWCRFGDPWLLPEKLTEDLPNFSKCSKTLEIKAKPPVLEKEPILSVSFEKNFETKYQFKTFNIPFYELSKVYISGDSCYEPARQVLRYKNVCRFGRWPRAAFVFSHQRGSFVIDHFAIVVCQTHTEILTGYFADMKTVPSSQNHEGSIKICSITMEVFKKHFKSLKMTYPLEGESAAKPDGLIIGGLADGIQLCGSSNLIIAKLFTAPNPGGTNRLTFFATAEPAIPSSLVALWTFHRQKHVETSHSDGADQSSK
jgi:hypothetical protein